MSILVNESLTTEVQVKRGLRQEDSLSSFLFLLAAEGLAELIRNTGNSWEFRGFHFNEDIHFETLHFENDMILLSDGSQNNLWSLKAFLRGCELSFGLCVNLSKSRLYGINLKYEFTQVASTFLSCEIGSIPFNFLGVSVSVNPCRKET